MQQGKQKADWIHTAHLIVTIANSFRMDGNQRVIRFDDVYPFAEGKEAATPSVEEMSDDEIAFDAAMAKATFVAFAKRRQQESGA